MNVLHENEVTCPACGVLLSGNDALETLADLRYSSQGFTLYACPHCGVELKIQEEHITVYYAWRKEAVS